MLGMDPSCVHSDCSYCLSVRACLCMCTHAGIQAGHTCLRGCITHKNAAPETCTYMHVSKSDLSLKIEEDVDGAIEMMAQTGSFSVPIRCRRKRCAVSGYLNVRTCTHVQTQLDIIGICVSSYTRITPCTALQCCVRKV